MHYILHNIVFLHIMLTAQFFAYLKKLDYKMKRFNAHKSSSISNYEYFFKKQRLINIV
ncbi:MAG: hypothetical protein ACD_15C00066G0008 [uncultured bacterium]|nr:MAG: hypothetical protein ACD_15C00066G0008 [uncultured bacterium]